LFDLALLERSRAALAFRAELGFMLCNCEAAARASGIAASAKNRENESELKEEGTTMVWFRRVWMAVGVIAALTVSTAAASAQTVVTYSLAGVETGFTATSSSFAGVASSDDGDFALWQAVVERTPFDGNGDATITGGSFQLDGRARNLQGVISNDGVILRQTSTCRRETFTVAGHVDLVDETGVPTGGFGDFDVTLTHHRRRVPGGQCVTVFATVEGLVTFTLPSLP
jgi:hypothetical protein